MDLTETERERLKLIDEHIASTRSEVKALKEKIEREYTGLWNPDHEFALGKLYKRLDGLGREKGGLLGKLSKLGPGNLNKRDRRAIKRIQAGISRPGTIPKKRLDKILAVQPALIKTYVYSFYRSTEPSTCQCCPDGSIRDKKGFGHIFCHAIRTPDDQPADKMTALSEAIEAAGIRDGDEFEIIIRKTGRRPFGDRLLLSYPGVRGMIRQPDKEVEP